MNDVKELLFSLNRDQEVKAELSDGMSVQCIITRVTGDEDSRVLHLGDTAEVGTNAFMLYGYDSKEDVRAYEVSGEENFEGRGTVESLKVVEDQLATYE